MSKSSPGDYFRLLAFIYYSIIFISSAAAGWVIGWILISIIRGL